MACADQWVGGRWGQSYDMWSVGVIFLELILGTSRVFQIESRTRAVIDQVFPDHSHLVLLVLSQRLHQNPFMNAGM